MSRTNTPYWNDPYWSTWKTRNLIGCALEGVPRLALPAMRELERRKLPRFDLIKHAYVRRLKGGHVFWRTTAAAVLRR